MLWIDGSPSMLRPDVLARTSPELLTFLAVGGVGYVVDVGAFNLLRSLPELAGFDPTFAKTLAVALAMVVTYVGNRMFTWRNAGSEDRRREVSLFVLFNVIGLGFSVVTLFISHHLMGLTSGLADNISANVVGLGLGTAFRFWSYRRFVFRSLEAGSAPLASRRPLRFVLQLADEVAGLLARGFQQRQWVWVPVTGLEPARSKAQDPKSCVSTSSTTPARIQE